MVTITTGRGYLTTIAVVAEAWQAARRATFKEIDPPDPGIGLVVGLRGAARYGQILQGTFESKEPARTTEPREDLFPYFSNN